MHTFHQFKRYLITGFLSFGVEYALFILLLKVFGVWYMAANALVYIVVFWLNFLMHRFWSFQSKGNAWRQVFLYTILFFINLAAISLLMYVFTGMLGINPMISKVLVMGAVVSWNFILYKKVIYR